MRLLLLRHAKSDWSDGSKRDEDRPLSARGRKAAARIGAHMRRAGYLPALVLCSTATRTRETLDLLLPSLKHAPKIRYDDSLYLAEWPVLLNAIQSAPDAVSPLMLVGHNPGLEQLAASLAAEPASRAERARAASLSEKFPTAALAVLDFQADRWRDIEQASGRLADFVRVRDLAGGGDG